MKLQKKYKSIDLASMVKNLILVILGTVILAFGCAVFVVPFGLVTGGVTGLSVVIEKEFGEFVSVEFAVTVLTWGLFFLGLIVLGKEYAAKTLIASLIFPVALSVFKLLVSPDVLDGFFYLQGSEHGELALVISALFGGVCIGTGCALTFIGGGTTGGLDIIAFILCKIFRKWKSSAVIFMLDAFTILLGMFAMGDLIITLLGIIAAFVGAIVIDRIFLGRSQAYTAQIVSEHHAELRRAIRDEVKRTTTVISVVGGYSGEEKVMLMVSFTMRQYADLINAINKIDKRAFVTIHRAHEINGEGWTFGEHD